MTYLTLKSYPISTRLPAFRSLWSSFDALERVLSDLDRVPFDGVQVADETDTAYTFTLALPGFKKGDVSVEVNDGTLSISASRGGGKVEEGKTVHGHSVSRFITLPTDVDLNKVEAKLEDGLLTITAAKEAAAVPRKVIVT